MNPTASRQHWRIAPTRVYRTGSGEWRCDYWAFGGPLYATFPTWGEAIAEAFAVEEAKQGMIS